MRDPIANQPKLIIFGLDCADPVLVFNKLADHMPVCRKLAQTGFAARMRSTDPPVTIPAWTSMTTGKDPGHLGCYGIRNRLDYGYDSLHPATARDIREPRIWDVLGDCGLTSIITGIPQTFPVSPLNGLCVAGIPAADTSAAFTWPDELRQDLLHHFPDYRIDIANFRSMDPVSLAEQIFSMTRTRFAAFRHLLTQRSWDFAMLVEIALDRLHHAFWHFWDPEHPLYPGTNPLQDIIPEYYSLLDGEIGKTLDMIPPETGALVVSDHGAQAMRGGVRINEWLIGNGWLKLKHQPERESPLSSDMVQWDQTRAWGEGGYFGRIFFNVAGREPYGVIRKAEYQTARRQLAEALESMKGPDNNYPGNEVIFPDRHYSRTNGIAPDLMVYFGKLAWRSLGGVGPNPDATGNGIFTLKNDRGPDGANHDLFGICIGNIPVSFGSIGGSSEHQEPSEIGVLPKGTFQKPGKCDITDIASIVYDFYGISQTRRLIVTS